MAANPQTIAETLQNNNNNVISPNTNSSLPTLTNVGASLAKCPTSHCVINIVPPRDLWDAFRPLYVADCRCGPHITFTDPFVEVEFYPQAASLLEEALKDFPPFQIKYASWSALLTD